MTITSTSTLTLEVTPQARDTIREMQGRVEQLENVYGQDHDWTKEASRSLHTNLYQLFNTFFGEFAIVTRDSELSLFVAYWANKDRYDKGEHAGFVHGVIWHRVYRKCQVCGVIQGYEKYNESKIPVCPEDDHVWNFYSDQPEPGSWSFHS